MTAATLQGIAPLVPVRDPVRSLPFYTDTLGFGLRHHAPANAYAPVARGGAGIILLGGADENALDASANNSAYV